MAAVSKDMIRQVLVDAFRTDENVLAFWEGGSLAMGRADQWSDLDLQVLTRDGYAKTAQSAIESALQSLGTIDITYNLPEPTWHGHLQVFYRLAEADPLWLVDLLIMEEKNPMWFLEPELHGRPVVYIDRTGITAPSPSDAPALARTLEARIAALEVIPELFHRFLEKDLRRGRPLDALATYQDLVQRAVEAVRILYCPWRYNFGIRYLQYDLPQREYERVLAMAFVSAPEELLAHKPALMELFEETTPKLQQLDLVQHLESTRGGMTPEARRP